MNTLYHLSTVFLILVNLAGLTALTARWIPSFAIARASALLVVGMGLFFVEHFHGFGRIEGLWLLTSLAAIYVLYRRRAVLVRQGFWSSECVFVLAFAYGLAWKWHYPVIYPTSERVTDLYFITNYLPGHTLPPVDNWMPTQRFDSYYGFQHYVAALMGRLLGLSPGVTYNMAFALLMAFPVTLAWDFSSRFLASVWKRTVVIVTFVIGGVGVTPFVHLVRDHDAARTASVQAVEAHNAMWWSQRFIGGYDQQITTGMGNLLFPPQAKAGWVPRQLPAENFGYQYYIGDYHPPIGGFFLLILAIALIGALERPGGDMTPSGSGTHWRRDERRSEILMQALLAATIPAMIITNTWTMPLQALLVSAWVLWRLSTGQRPDWQALFAGGVVGTLLIYPFLAGFVSKTLSTAIRWVEAGDHTPLPQFLAMHWPLLLFATLAFLQPRPRRLAVFFAVVFVGLLVMSEIIFVDDPSGDHFQRTNTVMKWWGWIWSGASVCLGALLLASRRRWISHAALVSMLLLNLYAIDTFRYWTHTGGNDTGRLDGHSLYTRDAATAGMFRYLAAAPYGIVLENWYGDAYTDSGVYAAFSAKPVLLGWVSHLQTWHGANGRIFLLRDQVRDFYDGKLAEPARWLTGNGVEYIVWNARDQAEQPQLWPRLNQAMQDHYTWSGFGSPDAAPVGIWIKR